MAAVTILKKESYLATVDNAVGSNLFRNLFAMVDGVQEDIVKNGVRSCALFVSCVLHNFKFVSDPHATVSGLERDLKNSGWRTTEVPQPGDIIVWEPKLQGDEVNAHVGFFVRDDQAISNNWETRVPAQHHMTYGTNPDGTPTRAITAVYTHDALA